MPLDYSAPFNELTAGGRFWHAEFRGWQTLRIVRYESFEIPAMSQRKFNMLTDVTCVDSLRLLPTC